MKIFILFFAVSIQTLVFSQNATEPSKTADDKKATGPIYKTGPGTTGKDTITGAGVAVAPSSMYFHTKPGKTETIQLTITNDQRKPEKFKISFQDYTLDNVGSNHPIPFGQIAPYGLSSYIVAAPTLVELQPGEKKKVAVTVSMPQTDVAYRACWTQLMVDRVIERGFLIPEKGDDKQIKMGVIPTYGFAVHIYQNPPNVKINKVEITSFKFTYNDSSKFVSMKAKNTGDGMGFCKSYLEINNLKTGKVEKSLLKQFVVFPGQERSLEFVVPGKIEKGKYSVLLVLDFGNNQELEVAESEVTVQ
ncbi:MAG: DUF916 domain-containing protein [Bacteroidia bacterium]|nr:DUF916 domain-containing protein [Bacteroidia bacterium]